MEPVTTSAFALPERLAAKADPRLTADDDRHLAAVAAALAAAAATASTRLTAARRRPTRGGQAALERDQEVHRQTARLKALSRAGLEACLGRMVRADGTTVYVGRLGLTDDGGRRLLVDWRSPAAEPFFGATHADPHGLVSRRRYRWTAGRVTDYWDEVFTPEGLEGHAALDDQSAFVASLGASRSARMRDVLGTIQADQDAIIRAGSRGALVVDGGPGTGKTVVALHRTAYLLHSDPRLGHRRGGVLVVGPHEPYLAYVGDVLPSLGEEGVRTCTLRDLVPEGAGALEETDPRVALLKASARMVDAIEPAVRFSERPPASGMTVETPWGDVRLVPDDWDEAFAAVDPGTSHNEAREDIWAALLDLLVDRLDGLDEEVPADELRRALARHRPLRRALDRAWPAIDAPDLVADLWSVPAYLRLCAPWLTPEEVRLLQRAEPHAWTVADLPLLDAARDRLGDPEAARRRRRHEAQIASERERRADVVDDLIASDDSELLVMSMLRGEDLSDALVADAQAPVDPGSTTGPFAHVVVDEAQELTDAQWRMVLRRCPSRSLTVVGDRAQARQGFPEPWQERLRRVGLDDVTVASLSLNYRTPAEVMAEAEPVIRAAVPDANVPASVRSTGVPVRHGTIAELEDVLDAWLAEHPEGTACVIGAPAPSGSDRVRSLTPLLAKGLEVDLVVLVDPEAFGDGIQGAVDRYVAMTRATQQLVVLRGASGAGVARRRAATWPAVQSW
ncbi:RNA polymerase recycling motor ATPase HelR [Actinotalea sp. JY-7876]|uniref:RNA polymerase recycling motor ATPase HelR n=2 Tax=unclassified Actinotalea TaxID=2638618 RepID=UPI0015F3869C|nr:RNA polymerase recycling motor ATPase HelR [Actinotalea sp. JY-7876]